MNLFYEWHRNHTNERGRFDFSLVVNHSFEAHWHTALEFTYILEGQVLYGVDDEQRLLQPGDIVLCNRVQIHHMKSITPHTKVILLIFEPGFVQEILQSREFSISFLDAQNIEKIGMPADCIEEIKHCFHMLVYEAEQRLSGYQDLCEIYLSIIAARLMRYVSMREPGESDHSHDNTLKMMQRAIKFMLENYSSNYTLEQLAEELYISPFYLSRLFRKYTGVSFKTYQNFVRVDEAKLLMLTSTYSIQDIAHRCGFNNIRTFNRVFKEYTGMTPSAFMKSKQT